MPFLLSKQNLGCKSTKKFRHEDVLVENDSNNKKAISKKLFLHLIWFLSWLSVTFVKFVGQNLNFLTEKVFGLHKVSTCIFLFTESILLCSNVALTLLRGPRADRKSSINLFSVTFIKFIGQKFELFDRNVLWATKCVLNYYFLTQREMSGSDLAQTLLKELDLVGSQA